MPTPLIKYVDPTWGFSFVFPEAWHVDETAAPGQAIVVVGPPGYDDFRVNVVATIEESVGEIDEWRARSEAMIAEALPLLVVLDRNRIQAASCPAIVTTLTFGGLQGESVTQMIWSSVTEDTGFCLTASCSTSDFATYAPLFQEILLTCEPPHAMPGPDGDQ